MPPAIRVELVPYSSAWEQAAQAETNRLLAAFADSMLTVHHIGSTAIPGIQAKPIVDLLPVVPSISNLDHQVSIFEQLGYQCWGEYGIAGRRYCTWDDPASHQRQFQLHCFEPDHSEIERHLAFRDYLRANPAKAQEYEAEKHRCRALHPDDSHAYSHAKTAWISAQIPAALAEYRRSL